MPKTSLPKCVRLRRFVKEFGEKIFSTTATFCCAELREKSVNFEKRYFVIQHCDSVAHNRNVAKTHGTISTKSAPQTLGECLADKDSDFTMDLCNTLIACDVPLHKIENHAFRAFLRNTPRSRFFRDFLYGITWTEATNKQWRKFVKA